MGLIDLNELEAQRKAKEIPVSAPSELQKQFDATWGKKKSGETVEEININDIVEFKGKKGRKQPFKIKKSEILELAESIKTIGITTPLIVRLKDGKYQIISGHHRFRACKEIGKETIPCIVRDIKDEDAERYVCECNIQRLKLLPSEYAKILERYIDIKETLDLTVEEVAKKFGIANRVLYRYVNISKLTEELQDEIDLGRVYVEVSDQLVKLSVEEQNKLVEFIEKYPCKTLVVVPAKKVVDMFLENDLEFITEEMYLECFVKPKKRGYKNKIYNNVYKKYDVPEDKEIDETKLDDMVTKYLDDYFSKLFEKAKVEEKTEEKVKAVAEELVEEETEDLER